MREQLALFENERGKTNVLGTASDSKEKKAVALSVPAELERDVRAFVDQLMQKQLVEETKSVWRQLEESCLAFLVDIGLAPRRGAPPENLSCTRDLLPKLSLVRDALVVIDWQGFHRAEDKVRTERVEEFWGSFPYREAFDDLQHALRTDLKSFVSRRTISDRPVSDPYKVDDRRCIRCILDQQQVVRAVNVTEICEDRLRVVEDYNPMVEGAARSLESIAENNPELRERVDLLVQDARSRTRKRSESKRVAVLEEKVWGDPPQAGERWEDSWD
jgi:hypothetical protein